MNLLEALDNAIQLLSTYDDESTPTILGLIAIREQLTNPVTKADVEKKDRELEAMQNIDNILARKGYRLNRTPEYYQKTNYVTRQCPQCTKPITLYPDYEQCNPNIDCYCGWQGNWDQLEGGR